MPCDPDVEKEGSRGSPTVAILRDVRRCVRLISVGPLISEHTEHAWGPSAARG
jgi:hypothetical protein